MSKVGQMYYRKFFLLESSKVSKFIIELEPHLIYLPLGESGLLQSLKFSLTELQNKWHDETLYNHLIECYKIGMAYTNDPVFGLACLFHDIGKIQTKEYNRIKLDYTFHKHEYIGAKLVRDFMRENKFRREDTQRVYLAIKNHQYRIYPDTKDKTIRHWLREIGQQAWEDIRILRLADRQANKANIMKPIIYKKYIDIDNRIQEQTQKVFNE
jgi:putative nucleotidyltransferase with HDIG domain